MIGQIGTSVGVDSTGTVIIDRDCLLGPWSASTASNCSASCGLGNLSVGRSVVQSRRGNGAACTGKTTNTSTCVGKDGLYNCTGGVRKGVVAINMAAVAMLAITVVMTLLVVVVGIVLDRRCGVYERKAARPIDWGACWCSVWVRCYVRRVLNYHEFVTPFMPLSLTSMAAYGRPQRGMTLLACTITGWGLDALLADPTFVKLTVNVGNVTAAVVGGVAGKEEVARSPLVALVDTVGLIGVAVGVGLLEGPFNWVLDQWFMRSARPSGDTRNKKMKKKKKKKQTDAAVEKGGRLPIGVRDSSGGTTTATATKLSKLFDLYDSTGSGVCCPADAVAAYVDWAFVGPRLWGDVDGGRDGGDITKRRVPSGRHTGDVASKDVWMPAPSCVMQWLLSEKAGFGEVR